MTQFHIGTSGFHYAHWRGTFYPAELPASRWLPYYAEQFDTVEINNSFYRLPSEETMRKWHDQTPLGFRFAIKASRFLTHVKRLREPAEPIERLLGRIAPLGRKQGPLLFQLPPRWNYDPERLRAFLEALPRGYSPVFEFRDPSWNRAEVYRLLRRHNAAYCIYELAGFNAPMEITADFTYIRLHGPTSAKYAGSYAKKTLSAWADRLRSWRGLKDAWVYFDNDQAGYAAQNALEMKAILDR